MSNGNIEFTGAFIKQFCKFSDKKSKFGVLSTPWYDNGCVCASDGVRCVRIHLNDENSLGDAPAFSFNQDACNNAKKGYFMLNEHYIAISGLPRFDIEVDKYYRYPDFNHLFESMSFADSNEFSIWCDASLVTDAANLAASLGKKTPIKFSFSKCSMKFEFDTPWGKCEGIIMMITHE